MTVPARYTIPPRTPFALTGSATDPNGDAVTYMWEQVDPAGHQGGSTAGHRRSLNKTKTNGALFRQLAVGDGHPADGLAEVQLAGPEPGDQPDARVPGHGADPGQQHERRDRPLQPDAAGDGRAVPVAQTPRVLLGVAADAPTGVGFLSDRTMTFRLTARDGKIRAAAASASPRPR